MTIEKIREELQDVRYYYSRKEMFDRAKDCVAKNAAIGLAKKYGNAVRDAPPRLYDIYVTLYVENNTQASAAEKCNLNRQLYAFFQSAFAKRQEGGEKHG